MQQVKIPRRKFINPIYKDVATVLETGENNGGSYALGELIVHPGGGNFFHTHTAFKETFIAVNGNLGVACNKDRFYLTPGESVTIPLHTPHHFFNDGKEAVTCHVKFEPAHAGFIKGIAIAYGLAGDGLTNKQGTPKNPMHLALIMDLTDTRPTGWISWFMPVFSWLARRARKKGVEQQLLDKYYYEQ